MSRRQGEEGVLDELSRGEFLDTLPEASGSIAIHGLRLGSTIEPSLVVISR